MRRWLSILLLVFMPFQFSWAAVAAYCEHESDARVQHFGHHEHEHRQPAGEAAEASKGKLAGALDVADCHLHCQCAAAGPVSANLPTVMNGSAPTQLALDDTVAPPPSRPERPQWVGHA